MERRMAMLKQKEDSDFIMGTSVRSPANKSKPDSENSTPAEKGVKRLLCLLDLKRWDVYTQIIMFYRSKDHLHSHVCTLKKTQVYMK